MRFFNAWFLMGASLSLEGMRRNFIGGTSLSLFIIIQYGLTHHADEALANLEAYLGIEQQFINALPGAVAFLLTPWVDHHNSGVASLRVFRLLLGTRNLTACEIYWANPAYPEQQAYQG